MGDKGQQFTLWMGGMFISGCPLGCLKGRLRVRLGWAGPTARTCCLQIAGQ